MSKYQEAGSILRVGCALSKWPHFDSGYLLGGPFGLHLIVEILLFTLLWPWCRKFVQGLHLPIKKREQFWPRKQLTSITKQQWTRKQNLILIFSPKKTSNHADVSYPIKEKKSEVLPFGPFNMGKFVLPYKYCKVYTGCTLGWFFVCGIASY